MTKENQKKENLVVAIGWHEEDGWYGKNYRVIFKGFDEEGFKTKALAKKDLSMLKKYVKSIKLGDKSQTITITEPKNLKTYIYCGAGPSWSCSHIHIDVDKFKEFIEKELEEMKIRREQREMEKERREMYANYRGIKRQVTISKNQ